MRTPPEAPTQATPTDEAVIQALYHTLLAAWNERNAVAFADLFSAAGHVIGFDGSMLNGRTAIEAHLLGIFRDHPTPAYVGKVREVRFLTPAVAVLRAVAGLIPPGQTDLNPTLNAVQTLVASGQDGQWHSELYQNTPAALHGQPEQSAALTAELRQLLP
ncbi:MAG: SgcJ/EcaC family oxidoreductase [Chloroflexota bacterium]|nr:SgcJ/EcaC family oxidoreductase [Chloroflexota bacterium]